MKKICACLFLVSVMLFSASCNRRNEIVHRYESEVEAESARQESHVLIHNPDEPAYTGPYPNDRGWVIEHIRKDGDKGYYEDKTLEDLQVLFTPSGSNQVGYVITPTGVIFEGANDLYFYNKLSGNFSVCCPDPLCQGDCLWATTPLCLYVSKEHMYFSADKRNIPDAPEESVVYFRCDLNRNHIEVLYEDTYANDTIVWAEGDKVYLTRLTYRADDSAVCAYGLFDCQTEEFTKLSESKNMEGIYGVAGGRLWYGDTRTGKLYSSNLDMTDEKEHFSEYEFASISKMGEDFLLLQIAPYPEEPWYLPTHVYNIGTGELADISSWSGSMYNYTINGDYLYYQKKLSEEEIAASPHREYYEYETEYETIKYFSDTMFIPIKKTVTCPNMAAGRLWRMNLNTMEEELLLEISYNGIPGLIGDYVVDGDVCYLSCSPYLNYLNYYTSENWPDCKEEYTGGGFMLVDFSNGTIRFLDSSGVEPHT